MKLENIGFYTLLDKRAENSSIHSPLWRCELILSGKCNFKCAYCRGIRKDINESISNDRIMETLDYWFADNLKNIRFSGGEPTLYKKLPSLVSLCKKNNVERIAVSTNGSADISIYKELIKAGANDFSISLDACCSSGCEKMAGIKKNVWDKILTNIKYLSANSYTTVGIVIDENNIESFKDIIILADSVGVSDIRIIPSAQFNRTLEIARKIPISIINKYPILRYRVNDIMDKKHVRGIDKNNRCKCWLALDDMAVVGKYHFPCIIYMREHGDPIGEINKEMRGNRFEWVKRHTPCEDLICQKNCLDVCVEYNKTWEKYQIKP